ncbi:unnamed protein product [Gadus morhua 'NCC']
MGLYTLGEQRATAELLAVYNIHISLTSPPPQLSSSLLSPVCTVRVVDLVVWDRNMWSSSHGGTSGGVDQRRHPGWSSRHPEHSAELLTGPSPHYHAPGTSI